jgi:hypothetical protein
MMNSDDTKIIEQVQIGPAPAGFDLRCKDGTPATELCFVKVPEDTDFEDPRLQAELAKYRKPGRRLMIWKEH